METVIILAILICLTGLAYCSLVLHYQNTIIAAERTFTLNSRHLEAIKFKVGENKYAIHNKLADLESEFTNQNSLGSLYDIFILAPDVNRYSYRVSIYPRSYSFFDLRKSAKNANKTVSKLMGFVYTHLNRLEHEMEKTQ